MLNKSKLKSIIHNLHKGNVLVVGDFAIDEMIYGQTARISREAPVLILNHTHTNIILGGGSNAAHNISALTKGRVATIGVYGEDNYGPVLLEALQKAGIDTSGMVSDPNRVTTVKSRLSGSSPQSVTQQIVRIDRETKTPVSGEVENKIIENINKFAPNFDAILLSDYASGMMTDGIIKATIDATKKNNIFLAVDAQRELTRFKEATILTPNQPDVEKTLGYKINTREALLKGGQELLDKTNAEMILITRGSDGMVLFEKNGQVSHIPAFNKSDVFDVTGAGDTVVGTITLALCTGSTGLESAILGNLAASIVIRHFGAATTSREELEEKLNDLDDNTEIKVSDVVEVAEPHL